MKILLIDDDEAGIKSLACFLTSANHCCQAFTVPQQAIAAYQHSDYDVVIADMIMPGMNGLDVLQRIRSLNSAAKVIIVTGQMDADIVIAALNNRAYAYLSKPLGLKELMSTLERIGRENQDMEQAEREHTSLALEYIHLKKDFEGLQTLLKARQSHV